MKFVIQRVTEAQVDVNGATIGKIGKGFLVLIGVSREDNRAIADKLVKKLIGLRIFEDAEGKTNLSLADVERKASETFNLKGRCVISDYASVGTDLDRAEEWPKAEK